jgi:hypothetical protein
MKVTVYCKDGSMHVHNHVRRVYAAPLKPIPSTAGLPDFAAGAGADANIEAYAQRVQVALVLDNINSYMVSPDDPIEAEVPSLPRAHTTPEPKPKPEPDLNPYTPSPELSALLDLRHTEHANDYIFNFRAAKFTIGDLSNAALEWLNKRYNADNPDRFPSHTGWWAALTWLHNLSNQPNPDPTRLAPEPEPEPYPKCRDAFESWFAKKYPSHDYDSLRPLLLDAWCEAWAVAPPIYTNQLEPEPVISPSSSYRGPN